MLRKTQRVVAWVLAVAAVWARPALAKDRFYFLGYENIQVIDGDSDTIVATIPVKGWTRESAPTSDKKTMYVTTNRHVIQRLSLTENRIVSKVDVNGDGWERFIFGFTLAPDEKSAYVGLMSRRTSAGEVVVGAPVVAQVSLETGKILRQVEVPWGVAHLLAVKGGQTVYALGQDLYKIDATGADLKIVETMPMFEKKWNILPLWDYAWESDGLAAMNYYTPEIMGLLTVDVKTGEIGDLPLKGDPVLAYSVIMSPDRKKAYAVMDDLSVIDVVQKTYGPAVPIKEGTSYGVSTSSDGKKIYAGAGGSSVTIYDAATLKPIKTLKMASDAMDLRRVTF
jgi:DNA-binding beta-propeller fold protein YncE